MKKVTFLLIILIQVSTLLAQNKKQYLAFELRYPIPTGNNFVNKGFDYGYTGWIDAGLDYNFFTTGKLGIGLTFNSSFLRLPNYKVNLMILSPKIKIEYQIKLNKIAIVPNIAIGYSNWSFRQKLKTMDMIGNPTGTQLYKEIYDGLTIKGATKLVFNSENPLNWYVQMAYEFTRLEKPEYGYSDSRSRNMKMFYPGGGVIWNL